MSEHPLPRALHKDYDALEPPALWPAQFDVTRWGLLRAFDECGMAGAAITAWATPGVDMLEGRQDLVVLWDIRVAAGAWRRGVGRALFRAAELWGLQRNCVEIKVETQVNAAA